MVARPLGRVQDGRHRACHEEYQKTGFYALRHSLTLIIDTALLIFSMAALRAAMAFFSSASGGASISRRVCSAPSAALSSSAESITERDVWFKDLTIAFSSSARTESWSMPLKRVATVRSPEAIAPRLFSSLKRGPAILCENRTEMIAMAPVTRPSIRME